MKAIQKIVASDMQRGGMYFLSVTHLLYSPPKQNEFFQ